MFRLAVFHLRHLLHYLLLSLTSTSFLNYLINRRCPSLELILHSNLLLYSNVMFWRNSCIRVLALLERYYRLQCFVIVVSHAAQLLSQSHEILTLLRSDLVRWIILLQALTSSDCGESVYAVHFFEDISNHMYVPPSIYEQSYPFIISPSILQNILLCQLIAGLSETGILYN